MRLSNFEKIFSDENIAAAIEHLKTKKNACGDDGVWLHDLEQYWTFNKEKILNAIRNGEYEPQIVHEKVIIQANGKHRKISLLSSVDRLLLRAIQQIIQEPIEQQSSQYSFAYQSGKGIMDAVQCASTYIEAGREFVIELDIKDFFDCINHDILLALLSEQIREAEIYNLLQAYIKCVIESDFRLEKKKCGILQGSPISPALSNLYLQKFDKWMEEQGYAFVRFSDNINIYLFSAQEGAAVYEQVANKLREYQLQINEQKKGIFSVFERRYLGYCFEKKHNAVVVKRHQKKKHNVYTKWHTSALEKVGHSYYIVNNGILSRRDYTLLFENEERKIYIPVETTNSINVYSNVELCSNVLQVVNKKSLNINIFDKYGVYQGSFYSANQRNRMKCLMKQVEIYQDAKRRLEYAKRIDMASLHNLRCNLRYYQKKKPSDALQKYISEISSDIKEMNEADSIDKILLIEARGRQRYYQSLNLVLADEKFTFKRRTKRPPQDEINALISFGNVYLYQKIAQIIHGTSVDIRISFVHSALKRYENLNLDLADIFKPLIVDRVIFRMINKKMISVEEHFCREQEGIFLNKRGKQIMLEELEWKMKQTIVVENVKYTYERLLHREVHNLEQSLLGNQKYKAFKYQM